MKIAMLAARHDIHTVRWANGLAERGMQVHLMTQHPPGDSLREDVRVEELPCSSKLGYLANTLAVRRYLKNIRCDLLHAHYASGYGTLARLSGFHPLVLSVWGADVYDFPQRSLFHRRLLAKNLRAADWIASTSSCMAKQTVRVESSLRAPIITPFGVDTEQFHPLPEQKQSRTLTIGTVKRLAPKYGVDVLIRSFARCLRLLPTFDRELRLRIVGGGPQRSELETLAIRLGIRDVVDFVGKIAHTEVCAELNRLDVYCALSRLDSESFGVAVIEASACERPVVVSNVGGLPEVVQDERTGIVVQREDVEQTSAALIRLITNPGLRSAMGTAGRQYVKEQYSWHESVSRMISLYERVVSQQNLHIFDQRTAECRSAA